MGQLKPKSELTPKFTLYNGVDISHKLQIFPRFCSLRAKILVVSDTFEIFLKPIFFSG